MCCPSTPAPQVRLGTYSTKTAHKPPAAEVALRAMVADPRCAELDRPGHACRVHGGTRKFACAGLLLKLDKLQWG